jgi:hypothetical protein
MIDDPITGILAGGAVVVALIVVLAVLAWITGR